MRKFSWMRSCRIRLNARLKYYNVILSMIADITEYLLELEYPKLQINYFYSLGLSSVLFCQQRKTKMENNNN